jgi:hypothetical protein
MEAGKNYGVRNAGYYALRALRTEKFFAYWGTDLTPFVTPLECGREYRVKFDVSSLRFVISHLCIHIVHLNLEKRVIVHLNNVKLCCIFIALVTYFIITFEPLV